MAPAAQRAGKAVGRTTEGSGRAELCTESGTAGDTQKSYCGRNDFSGQNGKEGKRVRNIVHCVRRDRTGVQRTGTSGTAVTGSFQAASLSAAILPGVLSLVFLEMISYGNGQRRRLKRAEKYLELCGTKMYGVINEMARYTGKSVRYVRRDLRKMLKAGMFPDGHLDDKETCFMLNNVIYRQYLETEKAYLEQKKISEQEKEQNTAGTDTQDTDQNRREQELHSIVAEGMEYIRHLRDLNDRIEGEAISEKLYRLENLLKEIFDRVQEHPEQMHRMHKLMDYYLPTMLKLVEQYAEFDEISSPGEDILDAKKRSKRHWI